MSLTVIYLPSAVPALTRLRHRNPAALARARQLIRALSDDPYPEGAVPWGGSGFYRPEGPMQLAVRD
jgi:hypothetical protein